LTIEFISRLAHNYCSFILFRVNLLITSQFCTRQGCRI